MAAEAGMAAEATAKLDFIHFGQPTTGTVSYRTFTIMGGLQCLSCRKSLHI
jgi:hypothetical protein